MKEYNCKTRKWEEKSTEKVDDLKKPKMCHGGKAHKMVLTIPDYLNVVYDFTPEDVAEFYASMDRIYEVIEKESAIQEKLGLKKRWNHRETRVLVCEVCGKRENQI